METEKETFWQKHGTKVKVTCGFIAGGIVMYIVGSNSDNITGGIKNGVQIAFGGNVTNTVTTELVRRGHPGFIVRDVESGLVAASKNHLAKMLDISYDVLQKRVESGQIEVLGLAQ